MNNFVAQVNTQCVNENRLLLIRKRRTIFLRRKAAADDAQTVVDEVNIRTANRITVIKDSNN